MGGEHSGVARRPRRAARSRLFHPRGIARTGQKLRLTSDARSRFERGVDPAFLDDGLAILTGLILDICGGEASRVTARRPPPSRPGGLTSTGRTAALGGIDVPRTDSGILESLGSGRGRDAVVPSWRRDVDGPADLVEEVTRIVGYDAIPSTALPRAEGVARPTATRSQMLERHVRRQPQRAGSTRR